MATTERGIYYQDDYTKAADILADMKKTAESTDDAIKKSEYNDKDVKDSIKEIQDKQTLQDKNIENIQTKNTEQDKLIQKLQNNAIQESTEEATSLHVEDASDLPAVLNISGNHYQEVQEGTSNLVVLNEGSVTQDGITINIKDGVATMSGSNTSDTTNYVIVGTAYLYAGQTYYMKAERNQTSGSSGLSIKFGSTVKWFTVGQEIAFECTQTGEYEVRVSFGVSAATKSGTFKLLISKTSGATWVQGKKSIPSVEYPSEIETVKDNIKIIQCNSNFLKKQEKVENVSVRGLVGQVLDDGTIVLNGTTTNDTYIQLTDELKIADYNASKNFEKHVLPSGSYKFISETSGQVSANDVHAFLYHADTESFLNNINIQRISESPKKETSFELAEKWRYYTYLWIKAGTTLTDFKMKFMLKRTDDNSEYIQNEQKVYNLAVQQEMLQGDYFDLEREKELHHFNKFIVTSSEGDWIETSDIKKRYVLFTNKVKSSLSNIKQCCSHNKNCNQWAITEDSFQVRSNGLYFRNSNITNKEEFNKFVAKQEEAGTPVNFYYECEKYELDLTEEQKQVLNELNALELFKGVNNIYTEQDLALLQLNYTADTKMYIDNKINSILGGN